MAPSRASAALDTSVSRALIDQVTNSGYKVINLWDRRIPTIYKLILAGLNNYQIWHILGGEEHRVVADIEGVRQLMGEMPNLESIRVQIAVELDSLYEGTLGELAHDQNMSGSTKAKLIEQARQILMDKADLYGLRSTTININGQAKLMTLVAELKKLSDGSASTTTDAAPLEGEYHVAESGTEAVLVESD